MNRDHISAGLAGVGAATAFFGVLMSYSQPSPPRYEFHTKGNETIRVDTQTGAVDYFVKGVLVKPAPPEPSIFNGVHMRFASKEQADAGASCPTDNDRYEYDPGPNPIEQW